MHLIALALASLPFAQSASVDFAREDAERLNSCIESIETDPETAYEDSLDWLAKGNEPAARYCNAMALIGLGQYEEGAYRLETLAGADDGGTLSDRAIYMAQAGNAWLSAGYADAALVSFGDALKIAPDEPGILKDRGATYFALKRWDEGIADMTSAIALSPSDVEAYRLRARAYLESGDLDAAKADVERALEIDGRNIETLVLRGDVREALRLAGR